MILNGECLEPPVSTPLLIRQIMTEGCWKNAPSARTSFSKICEQLSTEYSASVKLKENCSYYYLQTLPDID